MCVTTPDATVEEVDDDGVRLDPGLIKSDAVTAMEADPEYQTIVRLTTKKRKQQNKQKRLRQLRSPLRSAASSAREAYIRAARAQPDTPDVREMVQVGPM